MSLTRIAALALLLLGFACTKPPAATPAPESPPPPQPTVPLRTPPPWPTAPESPPPPGFTWCTVRHETIHARLLVPDCSKVKRTRDAYGYPRVEIDVDDQFVTLQFDSGIGQLGNTLARKPPTVHGLPVEKSHVGPENLAAHYRDTQGTLRILGTAPGVQCQFETFRTVPTATLDRIYTVCSSLRSPVPGSWRPATPQERANGGMTDVPEGGWVEGSLPSTPGSLLRPGKFVARLYLGGLVLKGAGCPESLELLRKPVPGEVEVEVEERKTPGGNVWVRRATDEYNGDRMPGSTRIFAWRDGKCCLAEFVPWTTPPTAVQADYAITLCDTFRAQ